MIRAICDLSNTPLQIMTLTIPLIRKNHPDAAELLDRLDYSVSKLKEIGLILNADTSAVKQNGGGVSFDAVKILQKQ